MAVNLLSISDVLIPYIYSPQIRPLFEGIDLVISCGDLPYYYLEYILSSLDVSLFFVRGNHDSLIEHTVAGPRKAPDGGVDLHGQSVCYKGLLLAGVEGCLSYRGGPFQYSQADMWVHVLRLIPTLMVNRIRHGRYLDIFVTHAPPWKIHDQSDRPHQGVKAFRWLIQVFRPAYHFHGHIHVYHPDTVTQTTFRDTQVINSYGYRRLPITGPG